MIGLGFLLLGVVLMLIWRSGHPQFFKRRPEVADPSRSSRAPRWLKWRGRSSSATTGPRARRPPSPRRCGSPGRSAPRSCVAFAYRAGPLGGEAPDLLDTLRERGEAVPQEALEPARAAGVQASAELVNDRPAEALAQVAEEDGAQMIAVGSYGERPLKALIIGSTPHRLMHVTAVPVLVVRGVHP